jgi:hypothetical protein
MLRGGTSDASQHTPPLARKINLQYVACLPAPRQSLRYNNYGNSMISGRIGCELAVLAVVCVLTIFLFPAMQGPYSVVHGPVTALLAAQAALRLRMALAKAALSSTVNSLISPLLFFSWLSFSRIKFRSARLSESSTILRC